MTASQRPQTLILVIPLSINRPRPIVICNSIILSLQSTLWIKTTGITLLERTDLADIRSTKIFKSQAESVVIARAVTRLTKSVEDL